MEPLPFPAKAVDSCCIPTSVQRALPIDTVVSAATVSLLFKCYLIKQTHLTYFKPDSFPSPALSSSMDKSTVYQLFFLHLKFVHFPTYFMARLPIIAVFTYYQYNDLSLCSYTVSRRKRLLKSAPLLAWPAGSQGRSLNHPCSRNKVRRQPDLSTTLATLNSRTILPDSALSPMLYRIMPFPENCLKEQRPI